MTNPFHYSKTAEHGSPALAIETARLLMGRIDCDPASSAFWNKFVKADIYYDKRANGLSKKRRWGTVARPWRIFLNPPGDTDGLLVKAFWARLVAEYEAGTVEQAFWVGFNFQQFTSLQDGDDNSPLSYPTVIPARRPRYYTRQGRSTRLRQGSPLHGSYYTWLPPRVPRDGWDSRKNATAETMAFAARQRAWFVEHTEIIGTAVFPRLPFEESLLAEPTPTYVLPAVAAPPPRERLTLVLGGQR